ncbi:MAG: hypothetical protein AB1591_07030 [Pseudomonadota bacterium]
MDNLKTDALLAPRIERGNVGKPAFFSNDGKHGELALLDDYLTDTLSAQDRVIPITKETAATHGMSLLAHLLTVQLDPTLEAHFWVGDDIGKVLGSLLYIEPKERAVWLNKLDGDALMRTISLTADICGTEFCASVSLFNRPFEGMVKVLKQRAPASLGLVFIGTDLPPRQSNIMLKALPDRLAEGGFMALTAATAKNIEKGLNDANIHIVGEIPGLMAVYQKSSQGETGEGSQ